MTQATKPSGAAPDWPRFEGEPSVLARTGDLPLVRIDSGVKCEACGLKVDIGAQCRCSL